MRHQLTARYQADMAIDHILDNLKPLYLTALCLLLTLIVGFFDHMTGTEINFFIFYAAPIWVATWYISKYQGVIFSLISMITWYSLILYSEKEYSSGFIPLWNGLIRLTFFMFIVYALTNIKEKLRLEELNADYDSLTGLLNGRGFRERLTILFPMLQRDEKKYTVAFIDLDNFKKVNDTMGHAEGDKVLKTVGEVMISNLRKSDLVSRLGGDEFIIFLPDTDINHSKTVMENMKQKLDMAVEENNWPIGFSIGVCVFDSATDTESAIKTTDAVMYDIKRTGKNNILYKEFI